MLYQALLQEIVEEASKREEIMGVLLTGSVARGDALPGTDIDLRFILTPGMKCEFRREARQGVLLEQGYVDVALAQSQLAANPMQVYAYLDGRILYDPQGILGQLREQAQRRFEDYQITEKERSDIAFLLGCVRFKLRVALGGGDVLRAAFVVGTSSWQMIEGLWAANNRPLPPNGSVLAHSKDLSQGPPDVEKRLQQLFCAETPQRIQVSLELLDWILARLDSEGNAYPLKGVVISDCND